MSIETGAQHQWASEEVAYANEGQMCTDRDLEEHSIKEGSSRQAVISLWSSWGQWRTFCLCLVGWSLRVLRAGWLLFKASYRVLLSSQYSCTVHLRWHVSAGLSSSSVLFVSICCCVFVVFILVIVDLRSLRTAVSWPRIVFFFTAAGRIHQSIMEDWSNKNSFSFFKELLTLTKTCCFLTKGVPQLVCLCPVFGPVRSCHHVALWHEGVRGSCTVFTQNWNGAVDGADCIFWR